MYALGDMPNNFLKDFENWYKSGYPTDTATVEGDSPYVIINSAAVVRR